MSNARGSGAWWFARLAAGSTGTKGLQSSLMGGHLEKAESFVREVTQNAVDACLNDRSVSMDFSSFELTPGQMAGLRGFLLGSGDVAERLKHFPGGPENGQIVAALGNLVAGRQAVRVLRVDDHGTCGLGGELGGNGSEDHFSRLVYFFGQTHEEGSTKGGAFGFGKSVYSNASALKTVIYYTRPADTLESRLIAVSLFPGHAVGKRQYLGYALCGVHVDDEHFPIHPVVGAAADRLAAEIGFSPRATGDTGTSVMVLGCDFAMSDLRAAMEKWWWPRLVYGTAPDGLTVRFQENGSRLPAPNPSANPELAPFVQAYRRLLDRNPSPPDVTIKEIRSTKMRLVGKVVLQRVEPAGADTSDEDVWYRSTVAMMRGPKLVVRYADDVKAAGRTPFVGVFVAEADLDGVFRRAENPAHTDWDERSPKLDESTGEPAYVRAVYKRCKILVQEFLNSFEAKPPPQNSNMHVLGDMLGKLFSGGKLPGPPPQARPRPISLKVQETRLHGRGQDQASITIGDNRSGEALPARMTITAEVLGDVKRSALEKLEVELYDPHDHLLMTGMTVEHAFEIPAQGAIKFTARTRSPADSPVRFNVQIAGRKP